MDTLVLPKYKNPSCLNCGHHDPEIVAVHSDGSTVRIKNVCTIAGLYSFQNCIACKDYIPKTKENMDYTEAIWQGWISEATRIIEDSNND